LEACRLPPDRSVLSVIISGVIREVEMKFVQLIEFKTGDIDTFNRTLDEWLAKTTGVRTPTRAIQSRDRDNDRTYVHIVEFPSYEAAMENSNRPETAEFAAQLAKLCDSPPTFRNLDVIREDDM
jgi:quinol monooxygenase YgiN